MIYLRFFQATWSCGIGSWSVALQFGFHLFFSLVAERLEQDMSGILTTICYHSFHCSCISKWTDSSCPLTNLDLLGMIYLFMLAKYFKTLHGENELRSPHILSLMVETKQIILSIEILNRWNQSYNIGSFVCQAI